MIKISENAQRILEDAYEDLILFLINNGIKNAYEKIEERNLYLNGTEKIKGKIYYLFNVFSKEVEEELKQKKFTRIRREGKNNEYIIEIYEGKIAIMVRADAE